MATAGYSGTPLAKKLGIKPNFKLKLYFEPDYYFQLFEDLPSDLEIMEGQGSNIDFIHVFVKEKSLLLDKIQEIKGSLKKNGQVWISWPKGASKIPTDLNREIIREIGLSAGLVDVKVAAVDEIWSGLKFVYRLKDR